MNNLFCVFMFCVSFLLSNNKIDMMIEDIMLGNMDRKYLKKKYNVNEIIKNNLNYSNTAFLQGLIENDGEESVKYFKKYYESNNDGKYNEVSIKKMADYYYSKGSYIQASKWYRIIPEKYPKSKNIKASINYHLNSLLISGNYKEEKNFHEHYKKTFPHLKFNDDSTIKEQPNKVQPNIDNKYMYSVLVGNYEKYNIALDYKKNLSKEGFMCRIENIYIDNKQYYSLRIGYYKTEKTANNIMKRLKSRLGITNATIITN